MKLVSGKVAILLFIITAATLWVVLKLNANEPLENNARHSQSNQNSLGAENSQSPALPEVVNSVPFKKHNDRILLKGKYLELVGGFTIPPLNLDEHWRRSRYLDLLPGTSKWVTGHTAGYVVELTEPGQLGTGDIGSWPVLEVGRKQAVLKDVKKISPSGVLWLNDKEILASGRKSYRSRFEPTWIAKVNIETGAEVRYTVTANSNEENDNFHLLQALGGGFMRITDQAWAKECLNGAEFLLGRGGYDVLGSPLGPALGSWKPGDSHAKLLLDFPHSIQPARRDPYYVYPSRDPNTYAKVQLPIWRNPDSDGGYWQAGDVGGIAFINHPLVKGILVTHNFGRGLHDYRAQGDTGSGPAFLVTDPAIFYSKQGRGNRGNHAIETGNSTYPKGHIARAAHVFDPDMLTKVNNNQMLPWEIELQQFEWPKRGIEWVENAKNATRLGSVTWDNKRQLLWAVIGNRKQANLVAYKIVVDETRAEEPLTLSEDWKKANLGEVPTNTASD